LISRSVSKGFLVETRDSYVRGIDGFHWQSALHDGEGALRTIAPAWPMMDDRLDLSPPCSVQKSYISMYSGLDWRELRL
jgi:hypothetical protein